MRPAAGARTMARMLSPNTHTEEVPVLVVGGGPAGLAAAAELARHEIPTLLVERRVVLSSHPRATVLSLRSMELMRAWGLEAVVRSRGLEVDNRMLDGETLADAASGSLLWVGYPNREQSRALSPVDVACVAQDEVEPLLLAHLREQRSARVSLGTELTRVWVGVDGVRATLRDLRTGSLRSVHARYLVVADGARSAVRGALGIGLVGPEGVMAGVTTLFRAPLWDVVGAHRHLIYSVNQPDAAGVFLPAGQGDRWLYGSAAVDASRAHDGHAADLIRLGAGVPDLPVRIEGARAFSAAAQLAECFRCGPVFLAGDAAHRVTPRGGTGLNLALHDGHDIGWKLAWAVRGWAGDELLDSYEAERRPVAEYAVARSADPRGSYREPNRELPVDLGGRIPHVWVGERSTLDLLGTGYTLFAGREANAPSLDTAAPVTVRRLPPIAARAIGAVGDAALLVRPDGRPAGLVPTPDGSGERALRAVLG
ncbi:MAG: FAD-dependent monooxygenase [Solirubrobacteraceae bacterium]